MSPKDTIETLGHHEVSESIAGNLSELTALARQAYDQKRTKDCLDLTRAILLIDPDNADALRIRSSVQSRMQRDLENTRAFLGPRPIDAMPDVMPPKPPESTSTDDTAGEAASLMEEEQPALPSTEAVLPSRGKRLAAYVLIVVAMILVVTAFALPSFRNTPIRAQTPTPSLTASETSQPAVPPPVDAVPAPDSAAALATAPVVDVIPEPPSARVPPAPVARPTPVSERLPDPAAASAAVVPAAPGKLAISSPTTVDIYKGDTYLGSAPVSLELPAGLQTLEYRHGDLRKTVTHTINSNGTTRAMITFDVTVQINARPWAAVSQEGIDSKELGQTPLSGVRVPIGSTLVFRNPQFQPKRYRVTGNETGIQIVFP